MLRLLDAFSGAGGCARGYQLAGFHVTGVDLSPQPRYAGDAFIQGEALEYIREHGHEYDAIHASPPCQHYTVLRHLHPDVAHPDLVAATRAALRATGRPYVIENVVGAPLQTPILLCGMQFGLRVYRHRLFESNVFLMAMGHPKHREPTPRRGWHPDWEGFITVAGGHNTPARMAHGAMGIDWMTRAEISQAIPPAYTHFVGLQLVAHLAYLAKETA